MQHFTYLISPSRDGGRRAPSSDSVFLCVGNQKRDTYGSPRLRTNSPGVNKEEGKVITKYNILNY